MERKPEKKWECSNKTHCVVGLFPACDKQIPCCECRREDKETWEKCNSKQPCPHGRPGI